MSELKFKLSNMLSERNFAILFSSFSLFLIGYLLFISNIGLDLTDESFYITGYQFLQEAVDSSTFHSVYTGIFGFLGISIIKLRVIRLVLLMLSSFVLFKGLNKAFFKTKSYQAILLLNFLFIGNLLSYTFGPLTVSYNSISTTFFGFIVGFWFLLISSHTNLTKAIYSFLLGVLYIAVSLNKVTNAAIIPFLFIVYIIQVKFNLKSIFNQFNIKNVLLFFLGIFFCLVAISGSLNNIIPFLDSFYTETFGFTNSNSHSLSVIVPNYFLSAFYTFYRMKIAVALIILLYVFRYFIDKQKKKTWNSVVFIASAIVLIFSTLIHKLWTSGQGVNEHTIQLIVICLTVFYLLFIKKIKNVKYPFLLLIPLIGAFGTNNSLLSLSINYSIFYFAFLYFNSLKSEKAVYRMSLFTIAIIVCTSQIITATTTYPYRQAKRSLATEKIQTKYSEISIDKNTNELIQDLSFLNDLEQEYLFTMSHQRGVNLFYNQTPFTLKWIEISFPEKACKVLSESKIPLKETILLIPDEYLVNHKEFTDCLASFGVSEIALRNPKKQIGYFDYSLKKEVKLNCYWFD